MTLRVNFAQQRRRCPMTFFSKVFAPTRNRRLNELVGLVLCVSALLLFLALASYSPLDPSLNSASILTKSHAARNWIGIFGAYLSDLILQCCGVGSFLLPIFMGMLGVRWIGSIPVEGLAGRIVGDVLIRYLNLAGAYIVCTTVLAVALYLTTAFSLTAIELWAPTRFAFIVALRDRFKDWQDERARKRQQEELEKRRAEKPTVTAQLVPARPAAMRQEGSRNNNNNNNDQEIPGVQSSAPVLRNGIERMMAEETTAEETMAEEPGHSAAEPPPQDAQATGAKVEVEVSDGADTEHKPKTTFPKIAGSYKLPPSSLLHRP